MKKSRVGIIAVAAVLSAAAIIVTPSWSADPPYKAKPIPFTTIETKSGTMVRIDGKEHPEAIPEHMLWRGFFLELMQAKNDNDKELLEHIHVPLRIAPAESTVLWKEAAAQEKRDERCAADGEKLVAKLTAEKASQIDLHRASAAQLIECRQWTLDAGDRILQAFSEDSRALVLARLDARRRIVTLTVNARDFDEYMLPR